MALDISSRRNEALVLYVGARVTPFPCRDPQRLADRYGSAEAADLVGYCEKVLQELFAVAPDWSVHDLATATELAVGAIATEHPELSPDALSALRWSFSYEWK